MVEEEHAQGSPRDVHGIPSVPFAHLDTVWVQLTGTVCNIACRHCFIGCGPKVTRHQVMSTASVLSTLAEAENLGTRAVWFTGGEPTLHPDFLFLCETTLERFPLGVLTNGMLIDDTLAGRLAEISNRSEYSLEVRVSLDGSDVQSNDRIRGAGVFRKTCDGIASLAKAGLLPVVAVAIVEDGPPQARSSFVQLLRELGVDRPRVKWIPSFRIGREATRRGGRAYRAEEHIRPEEIASTPDAAFRLSVAHRAP